MVLKRVLPTLFRVLIFASLSVSICFFSTKQSNAETKVQLDFWHSTLQPFYLDNQENQFNLGNFGTLRARLGGRYKLSEKLTFNMEGEVIVERIYGDVPPLGTSLVDPELQQAYRFYDRLVMPKKFNLEWESSIGLFLVGHTSNEWGLGLVATTGDQSNHLFDEGRRGSLVERILFATAPLRP